MKLKTKWLSTKWLLRWFYHGSQYWQLSDKNNKQIKIVEIKEEHAEYLDPKWKKKSLIK